jgi:hypothetical protein
MDDGQRHSTPVLETVLWLLLPRTPQAPAYCHQFLLLSPLVWMWMDICLTMRYRKATLALAKPNLLPCVVTMPILCSREKCYIFQRDLLYKYPWKDVLEPGAVGASARKILHNIPSSPLLHSGLFSSQLAILSSTLIYLTNRSWDQTHSICLRHWIMATYKDFPIAE